MKAEQVESTSTPAEVMTLNFVEIVLNTLGMASEVAKRQPSGELLDSLSIAVSELALHAKELKESLVDQCVGGDLTKALKRHSLQLGVLADMAQMVNLQVRQRALWVGEEETEELYLPGRGAGAPSTGK